MQFSVKITLENYLLKSIKLLELKQEINVCVGWSSMAEWPMHHCQWTDVIVPCYFVNKHTHTHTYWYFCSKKSEYCRHLTLALRFTRAKSSNLQLEKEITEEPFYMIHGLLSCPLWKEKEINNQKPFSISFVHRLIFCNQNIWINFRFHK